MRSNRYLRPLRPVRRHRLRLRKLIDAGHSLIIIEHNLDVIRSADWLIDLGPEGGLNGGHLLFEGTPEELVKLKDTNHTARFLAEKV